MQYDNLPKELRDNGAFCLWNYEERKGKVKPDGCLIRSEAIKALQMAE